MESDCHLDLIVGEGAIPKVDRYKPFGNRDVVDSEPRGLKTSRPPSVRDSLTETQGSDWLMTDSQRCAT